MNGPASDPAFRCLVCTHHLRTWAGSEVVSLELTEALQAQGGLVTVYAPFILDSFITEAFGDGMTVLTDPETVDLRDFDLVYCQHQTLSRILPHQDLDFLTGPGRPLFVYNHLSPIEPFEFPGPYCETDVADLIWSHSPHTVDHLMGYGAVFGETRVVPNPAPAVFHAPVRADVADVPDRPRRLLSVSNHLPEELAQAFDLLRAQGVEITRIGAPDDIRRLCPADLAAHDGVVTIGKTVQYALLGRCPVFCYDGFFGPGWLTEPVYEAARGMNFSGRSHPDQRGPEILARELMDGFAEAAAFVSGLAPDRLSRFDLQTYVDDLLSALKAHKSAPAALRCLREDGAQLDVIARRWQQEAALYGLVDRHYGRVIQVQQQAKERHQELLTQIKKLKAGQNGPKDKVRTIGGNPS